MSDMSILVNRVGKSKGRKILENYHMQYRLSHKTKAKEDTSKRVTISHSKTSRVENRGVVPGGCGSKYVDPYKYFAVG